MSEKDKKGFLDGDLEIVQRSNIYWEHMDIIKGVMNAINFTHFWIDRSYELQSLLRKKAPDVVDDWFRYKVSEFTVTFSFSDDAIKQLQPTVREFSSFGAAVRILGCYESYFSEITRNTIDRLPDKVDEFSKKHNTGKVCSHKGRNFMWKKLGRGLTFIEDIFGYNFHPSYSACINFFFELRNVAVHNSNVADEELCNLSRSKFINMNEQLTCGTHIEWSLLSLMQLHQFVLQILDEIDAKVYLPLMLETKANKKHWYYKTRMQ